MIIGEITVLRSERGSETQFDCIDGRTLTLAFKDVRMGREVVVGLSKTLCQADNSVRALPGGGAR